MDIKWHIKTATNKDGDFCLQDSVLFTKQIDSHKGVKMSYSRWGDSTWYTYWEVQFNNDVETRDSAKFTICGVVTFTAKEMRDDLERCIDIVKSETESSISEIRELKSYMLGFLEDVDIEYGKT